jgi:hypothetical protein
VIHYCTYFDRNYLTRALAMHASLVRHSPPLTLWALCLDDTAFATVTALGLESLRPIRLADLEAADPSLLMAKANRSAMEYYFTLSPALPLYLLNTIGSIESITYLDSDLLFYSSPKPIFDELDTDSVLIIPHRFPPRLANLVEYGVFNVGWLTFRNDDRARAVLERWHGQCLEWCYDRLEDGKYADQLYLDQWPALPGVHVLSHPGANLAPWNFDQYAIGFRTDPPTVDGRPLIFYHFQSFKAVAPGLWDLHLDSYSARMNPGLQSWLYGGYLRELRRAARFVRSRVSTAPRSHSIRLPRYGWRLIVRRLRKGQIIVTPRSLRL